MIIKQTTNPMDLEVKFDPITETPHCLDDVTETLNQYNKRKVFYHNPICLNDKEYLNPKQKLKKSFDYWENSIFQEFLVVCSLLKF